MKLVVMGVWGKKEGRNCIVEGRMITLITMEEC